MIAACALLIQQGVDLQCTIFGEGEQHDSLQRQIDRLNLANRLSLQPFVPHARLRERFAAAHVCALPCRIDPESGDRDGIPNVLLEAIDCGAIVVTSDLPSMRELITHRTTGFLVQADDPAKLADVIRQVQQAEPDWPGIRQESRSLLEQHFALEENCARFRRLIEASSRQALHDAPARAFVKEERRGDAPKGGE